MLCNLERYIRKMPRISSSIGACVTTLCIFSPNIIWFTKNLQDVDLQGVGSWGGALLPPRFFLLIVGSRNAYFGAVLIFFCAVIHSGLRRRVRLEGYKLGGGWHGLLFPWLPLHLLLRSTLNQRRFNLQKYSTEWTCVMLSPRLASLSLHVQTFTCHMKTWRIDRYSL